MIITVLGTLSSVDTDQYSNIMLPSPVFDEDIEVLKGTWCVSLPVRTTGLIESCDPITYRDSDSVEPMTSDFSNILFGDPL